VPASFPRMPIWKNDVPRFLAPRSISVHFAFRRTGADYWSITSKGGLPMKIFAAVVLAVCLSAGAAQAKMMKMHMAACGDGMVKASCMCKASMGHGHAWCKKGMWCHTWSGTCSH